eukprot:15145-Rhodomonas_salina.1
MRHVSTANGPSTAHVVALSLMSVPGHSAIRRGRGLTTARALEESSPMPPVPTGKCVAAYSRSVLGSAEQHTIGQHQASRSKRVAAYAGSVPAYAMRQRTIYARAIYAYTPFTIYGIRTRQAWCRGRGGTTARSRHQLPLQASSHSHRRSNSGTRSKVKEQRACLTCAVNDAVKGHLQSALAEGHAELGAEHLEGLRVGLVERHDDAVDSLVERLRSRDEEGQRSRTA